jgi:hypothetical protein
MMAAARAPSSSPPLVGERHAPVGRQHHRSGAQVPGPKGKQHGREQRQAVPLHGRRRQAVGDDETDVHRRSQARQALARGLRELAAEVGTSEILAAIAYGTLDHHGRHPEATDLFGKAPEVPGDMYRIARLRMGELEFQEGRGREPAPTPPEPDAGLGKAPQHGPGIVHSARSSANRLTVPSNGVARRGPARALLPSKIPMRFSHASNSGAGRRPSTSRR